MFFTSNTYLIRLLCLFIISTNLWIENKARLIKEHVIKSGVDEQDTVLGPEDFAGVDNLKEVDLRTAGIQVPDDPLTHANKFEGDIAKLNASTIHKFINASNSFGRAAIKDQWRRWPNNEIPYVISSQYGTYSRQVIAKAFDEYRKKTCIRFVPRDEAKHRDYIYIHPDDGCYSLVGRTGGRQPVSLDAGCIQLGTIIHELMHSSGFFHEQSRADRDDFIKILTENLQPGTEDQFEKYSLRTITHLDLPYDYGSIMHYGPKAFSRNGRDTIQALKSGGTKMGQREGFSDFDVKKLNKLYQCDIDIPDGPETDEPRPVTDKFSALGGRTTARPPVLPPSPENCEDKKWQCFFWKSLGYCETEEERMRRDCPRRCNMCGQVTGDENSNRGGVGGSSGPCDDDHSHCATWALEGRCNRAGQETFLRKYCQKSCGYCSDSSGSGNRGGRTVPSKGLPNPAPKVPPTPAARVSSSVDRGQVGGEECEDKIAKCKTYAYWGLCTGSNEEFMRKTCKKSCNVC